MRCAVFLPMLGVFPLRGDADVQNGRPHLLYLEGAVVHPLRKIDHAAFGQRDPLILEAKADDAAQVLRVFVVRANEGEDLICVGFYMVRRSAQRLVIPNALHVAHAVYHGAVRPCYAPPHIRRQPEMGVFQRPGCGDDVLIVLSHTA